MVSAASTVGWKVRRRGRQCDVEHDGASVWNLLIRPDAERGPGRRPRRCARPRRARNLGVAGSTRPGRAWSTACILCEPARRSRRGLSRHPRSPPPATARVPLTRRRGRPRRSPRLHPGRSALLRPCRRRRAPPRATVDATTRHRSGPHCGPGKSVVLYPQTRGLTGDAALGGIPSRARHRCDRALALATST